MPVELKGALATVKAMRKFDPDLLKEMNKDIKNVMIPLRNKARGYAPSPQPDNLYGWAEGSVGKKITKRNSAFRNVSSTDYKSTRLFPLYDYSTVVKGIKYSQAPSKRNSKGFRSLYFISNQSAAGAIYETAGRKNPGGDSNSKSNNPNAGAHFINRMGPLYGEKQKERGRMIYRAAYEDRGKAQDAVILAISTAIERFNTMGKTTFKLAA
jgi:hypothetical protein